jgi:hypothetical protein
VQRPKTAHCCYPGGINAGKNAQQDASFVTRSTFQKIASGYQSNYPTNQRQT